MLFLVSVLSTHNSGVGMEAKGIKSKLDVCSVMTCTVLYFGATWPLSSLCGSTAQAGPCERAARLT